MFAVGQDGVNSTLIISDGKFNVPSIERGYHIGLDSETDIEIIRSEIYERERNGERSLQSIIITEMFADEIVGVYSIEDCAPFQSLREEHRNSGNESKRNIRDSGKLQNRKGSNSKTQPKYSVSDSNIEMSSADGIFFDSEKSRDFMKDFI